MYDYLFSVPNTINNLLTNHIVIDMATYISYYALLAIFNHIEKWIAIYYFYHNNLYKGDIARLFYSIHVAYSVYEK